MRKLLVLAAVAQVVAVLVVLNLGQGQPTSATHQGGLVAYWPFDESGGTTAFDAAHGNDGTLTNGATYQGGTNVPPVTGNADALSLDGGDDFVLVPNDPSLEPSSVTVQAWVNRSGSPGSSRYILSKGASGCTAASYGLYTGGSGGLRFYVFSGSSFVLSPDAGAGVWDGYWHHVAGSFDGSHVRLYVDGVEVGSGTSTAISIGYGLPSGNDLLVGAYRDSCFLHYGGLIDEVCVWNRDLSTSEIAAYASGVPCDVLLFDDQAAFETATGAAPLSIPAANTLTVSPAFGIDGTGCAESISMPNITITAPAAVSSSGAPGLTHPICIFEPTAMLPDDNTVPQPESPTIVANGEDDYLLVFDAPVNAVGVELLTNSTAAETVTLKDAEDNEIASLSVDSLTSPNTFQFVGFSSPTPIKSVFVDTTNGATQNEGISAIKAAHYVDIDIKPGSDPNCINPDSNGVIPVAILTTEDFDATTVDPATVQLEGAGVAMRGKSDKMLAAFEDVDGDGDLDLVVKIVDNTMLAGFTTATLTGETFDGTPIEGTDSICIVPPNP